MKNIIILAFMLVTNWVAAQSILNIKVYGNCGMCQDRIENTAKSTIGVNTASWDEVTKILTLDVNSIIFVEQELHEKMVAVGHDTDKLKSDDEVYAALHSCCKYERPVKSKQGIELENSVINENQDSSIPKSSFSGLIVENDDTGNEIPIIGANVYWLDGSDGTVTDNDGIFTLSNNHDAYLVVSYVGYNNDTIFINEDKDIKITLTNNIVLDGVNIVQRTGSSQYSFIEPIKILKISDKELMKAACCNLSESFETIPSVDVSTTDAVSGKRRIEMLGLAGPYVQITTENMPFARGLASVNGLSYIPGPWVEGMMLNQGSGSVVNGYESIAGQINIELKKADYKDQLLLNLFANEGGRYEFNATSRSTINEKWSSAQLLHGSILQQDHDRNNDGFLDMPKNKTISVTNRWRYFSNKGVMGQIGISAYYDDVLAGQKGFDVKKSDRTKVWGSENQTKRINLWGKRGMVFENKPFQSIGLQFSSSYQTQDAYFGLKPYEANHTNLYFNGIFQSQIANENHTYKTGLSFNYDNLNEVVENGNFERNEYVPGAFFEYTYTKDDKWTVVGGFRADYHNNYGLFYTPRMHVRFAPLETLVFRLNAGIGSRTANIFVENMGYFASNRTFIIHSEDDENPYGLDQERATGFGGSITKVVQLFNNDATISVEAHHINFDNQIIVDIDASPQEVNIYNLNGKSYTTSIQTQFEFRPISSLAVRMAYRYNDVKTDFLQGRLQKSLNSAHRAFLNFDLALGSDWRLDYTFNWQGDQRLPITISNPEGLRKPAKSNTYNVSNFQLSKTWNDKFDLYFGAENIFNTRIEDPILDAENPFSEYFDSSIVWGPIFGRNIYAGIRWRLRE